MSKAAPGSFVSIYFDGRPLLVGDVIQTGTGRLYGVVSIRLQKGGKHKGRQHLRVLVLEEMPALALERRVVPLFWYARGKRKPSR